MAVGGRWCATLECHASWCVVGMVMAVGAQSTIVLLTCLVAFGGSACLAICRQLWSQRAVQMLLNEVPDLAYLTDQHHSCSA
jgi:hypothetical protein